MWTVRTSGNPTNRRRRVVAAIIAVAVLATACGGSSSTEAARSASVSDGDAVSVDAAPTVDRLLAHLGSPDAALDAVILALNDGYQPAQILAGIDANHLEANGSIAGVAPGGEPLDFVASDDGDGQGEGASGYGSAAMEVRLVRFAPSWTLEQIRAITKRNADLYGFGNTSKSALQFVVLMAKAGFSAGEITEMIVVGVDEVVRKAGCSGLRIGQEVLVGPHVDDECDIAPGRYPASMFEDDADETADQVEAESDEDATSDANPTSGESDQDGFDPEWAGPLQGPLSYQSQGENTVFGELETVEGSFSLSGGQLNVEVTRTTWTWQRGGPEPLDRNCGARIIERLVGSAPLTDVRAAPSGREGRVFRIDLVVDSSTAVDRSGTLCDLVDWNRVEREPGRSGGWFSGIVGPWGIEANLGQWPMTWDLGD